MLTRVTGAAGLVVLLAAALAVSQPAARAAGGPGGSGGGGLFGSIQCGQAYSPSCALSAGSGGTSAQAGKDSRTLTGASGASPGCAGTRDGQFGCVPPGCRVTSGAMACPLGAAGAAGRPAAQPAPGTVAQLARRYLLLPDPVIRSSPAPADLQLTGLPVWLWISRAAWAPLSRTAVVPGEQVTATAAPVRVTWRPGDGSMVICRGPGTPYSSRYSPAAASPDCGHTYTAASARQPGGAYQVTATITWDISWRANGGAAGALPPLFTTAAAEFRVADSQAINISGGGP